MPLHFTKAVSRIIFAIGVMNFDYWGFSSRAGGEDVKPPDTGVSKSIVPAALAQLGVQFNATYIGEFLVNVSGGAKRGAVYDGRLDLGIDVDLEKAIGWTGAKFHANMFQIHGQGISRDYICLLYTSDAADDLLCV